MGVSDAINTEYAKATRDMVYVVRPGYSRISFPYIMSDAQVEYIVSAVEFVASHGWKFLPQYEFKQATGAWTHKDIQSIKMPSIEQLSFNQSPNPTTTKIDPNSYQQYLDQAAELADAATKESNQNSDGRRKYPMAAKFEHLRWFAYPWEGTLIDGSVTSSSPFEPHVYSAVATDDLDKKTREFGRVLWSRSKQIWKGIKWSKEVTIETN
ncbi:Aste57867_12177 [Aphanomyces stellatus]|uniref:Aste57867_12177 protein n=1 Tax=Aphanomyces stellatus TaxID=120398 RepID=A0A485KUU8_9STRA|nr:hypothetical protein As57867_012132 [Aphanomyces stellatus]VFT89031.1 Aste57867_12177 [Aphanomyces stellatus]